MINTKVAVVFPGQGSQSVGMLSGLFNRYSEIKTTFEEASESLGYDLWSLVEKGPAEKLNQTVYTQPALLASAYAIWRIIQARHPLNISFLAGHSLGEYTALVAAEALNFDQAIQLVAMRGRLMQEAVPKDRGAMAAIIGLDEETVQAICGRLAHEPDQILAPANYNSIGQIVIAGHKQLVEEAIRAAKEKGAKIAAMLPVSVPSHCKLMMPAAEGLQAYLSKLAIHVPNLAVINNVDVQMYQDKASIQDGLVRQLYSPVRWVDTIQYFKKQGMTHIIECGPGKVLSGLNKRIDKQFELMNTSNQDDIECLLKNHEVKLDVSKIT